MPVDQPVGNERPSKPNSKVVLAVGMLGRWFGAVPSCGSTSAGVTPVQWRAQAQQNLESSSQNNCEKHAQKPNMAGSTLSAAPPPG
eukprot:5804170-Prymnesium_polylepis.1